MTYPPPHPHRPNPYQQPGYPPNQWPQPADTPAMREIQSKVDTAFILGILAVVLLGIVLGPIAISQANRAEQMMRTYQTGFHLSSKVNIARTLGWIGLILHSASLLLGCSCFCLSFAAGIAGA